MPGTYQLLATVPQGAAWSLRAARVGGRDLLDAPLEIGASSGDVDGAVLTMTDQHSELSGRLQDAAGVAASGYSVVVFPTDSTLWRPGARRLQTTRAATDGTFTFRDLPGGTYLLAALTDLDPTTWQTPDFLNQVVSSAIGVTLGEGEKKTQNVQIAR